MFDVKYSTKAMQDLAEVTPNTRLLAMRFLVGDETIFCGFPPSHSFIINGDVQSQSLVDTFF